MKKINFIISMVAIILLTGCFNDPQTILTNASKKMSELDNYHMTMKIDMTMELSGSTINMNMNADSDIDVKQGIGVTDMTSSLFGITSTEKTYMTFKDGIQTTYSQDDEQWYKEESEYQETIDFDLFNNVSNIEKVEGNTYKLTLSEQQIKELMDNVEQTDSEYVEYIDFDKVEVKVTVSEGYITNMTISIPLSTTEDDVTMNMDITMEFEFSKFNEISNITIPEEVLNNALDMTLYNLQSEVENYISEIEWDVYENDFNGTIYTNNELDYSGSKPSKVEVTLEDGIVINGYIEIDGYKATIENGNVTNLTKLN